MSLDLNKMSPEVRAEFLRLQTENAALKNTAKAGASLKVSPKGCIVLSMGGRFPVSLYRDQWAKVFGLREEIELFMHERASEIETAEKSWAALPESEKKRRDEEAKAKMSTRAKAVEAILAK